MLMCSMSVSVDGFINNREGGFAWTPPCDPLFQFHLEEVGKLGAYLLGRRLYEMMTVWETEPAMRNTPLKDAFADVWCALPKVVFSRTLSEVQGNARIATGSVAEEIAALAGLGKDVSIGGAELASAAIELDLVDEFRLFRHPVLVGGGTPYFPPVSRDLALALLETRVFGGGVVYERYGRVRG
jgi:dihydrofolate reductase